MSGKDVYFKCRVAKLVKLFYNNYGDKCDKGLNIIAEEPKEEEEEKKDEVEPAAEAPAEEENKEESAE